MDVNEIPTYIDRLERLVHEMRELHNPSRPPRRFITIQEMARLGYGTEAGIQKQVQRLRAELVAADGIIVGSPHRIDPSVYEQVMLEASKRARAYA